MKNELEQSVLTRLLHAHPEGLGKEILDDLHGEEQVALCIKDLRAKGLIHTAEEGELVYPVKLSKAGVKAAKEYEQN